MRFPQWPLLAVLGIVLCVSEVHAGAAVLGIPTPAPSVAPSVGPTAVPSVAPSAAPLAAPTDVPTGSPSTAGPTNAGDTYGPSSASPTYGPTNAPIHSQCASFGPLEAPPTCPIGYSIINGTTLTNRRIYRKDADACITIQAILCQCGSAETCPKATCKTYLPLKRKEDGSFVGLTELVGALYQTNFTAWAHSNSSAESEAKILDEIQKYYLNLTTLRAEKIASCQTTIQVDNASSAVLKNLNATCSNVVEDQFTVGTTGLKCCRYPKKPVTSRDIWYPDYARMRDLRATIQGSNEWDDTPTRCTLENPLVQTFYSNLSPSQTLSTGRIALGIYPAEVEHVRKHVQSALENEFGIEGPQAESELALSVNTTHSFGDFAIVIGVGQRDQNVIGIKSDRRLLGGGSFENNDTLQGKQPGWYKCEMKYVAMVTISSTEQGSCQENGQSGRLCEPPLAASLQTWMTNTYQETASTHGITFAHSDSQTNRLMRPNNEEKVCARVDAALRLGLAAYRFKGFETRFKGYWSVEMSKRDQTKLGEGTWSVVQTTTGAQPQHRCLARSVSRIVAKTQCAVRYIGKVERSRYHMVADLTERGWAWNGRAWNHQIVSPDR